MLELKLKDFSSHPTKEAKQNEPLTVTNILCLLLFLTPNSDTNIRVRTISSRGTFSHVCS